MAQVTIRQIADAIKTTLATASGINLGQSGTTITEGIQDAPLLQVYFQSEDTDATGMTDRLTFRAGVRVSHITLHVDVYTSQRAHIGEDIAAVETLTEAVREVLAAQDTKPYFNLTGIQAYHWRAERVTFTYGEVNYMGVRFVVEVWVY